MTRDAEHTPTGYGDAASVVVNQAPAPSSLAGGAVWFGVTGASDETEALAVALFDTRCPGARMTDEDLHYYRAAAQRAMQAVTDELGMPALATREEAPADNSPERALQDAVDFGVGFLVDGERVSPDRVTVCRGEEAPAGTGEDVWSIVRRVANLTVAGGDPLQDPAFAQYPAIADLVARAQAALRAQPQARSGEGQ